MASNCFQGTALDIRQVSGVTRDMRPTVSLRNEQTKTSDWLWWDFDLFSISRVYCIVAWHGNNFLARDTSKKQQGAVTTFTTFTTVTTVITVKRVTPVTKVTTHNNQKSHTSHKSHNRHNSHNNHNSHKSHNRHNSHNTQQSQQSQ